MVFGIIGSVLLFAIAGIHIYWLFGGKAGFDRCTPLDRRGNRWNPGKLATVVSALVFLVAGLIPLISLHIIDTPIPAWIVDVVLIFGIVVLLARGLGLFVVSLHQPKPRDIFHRYNIALYTPLCLFLALCYLVCLLWFAFHIAPYPS